jgi:hypothetical protein
MSKMHEMTRREFAEILKDYAKDEDSWATRAKADLAYWHHVAIAQALREAARRLDRDPRAAP